MSNLFERTYAKTTEEPNIEAVCAADSQMWLQQNHTCTSQDHKALNALHAGKEITHYVSPSLVNIFQAHRNIRHLNALAISQPTAVCLPQSTETVFCFSQAKF